MTNLLLHVDCQKRFPMYHTNSMYQVANLGRGSAFHQDFEHLPVDWECVKIFHYKLILHLEILQTESKNHFSCNSCICEVSSCIVAWLSLTIHTWRIRQFAFPELSQFFHFMDILDASVSKCFFSLSQSFVKSGLLSSRFFIPTIDAIQFETIVMILSLKFTNASVESINFTFFLQDFRFRFCSSRTNLAASSGSENLKQDSPFPSIFLMS